MIESVLRVASWNIAGLDRDQRLRDARLELLGVLRPDLLLLQHASPRDVQAIVEGARFDWSVSSADLQVASRSLGVEARCLAAVLGRGPQPRATKLFAHLPRPNRAILVEVDRAEFGSVCVVAFDATGLIGRDEQRELVLGLARWLEHTKDRVVVGVSADSIRVDHPDRWRVKTAQPTGSPGLETGEPGDELMFGTRPIHQLEDALRRSFFHHPEELERVRRDRPDGPLAVSYLPGRGMGGAIKGQRQDFIWISRDLEVNSITYDLDRALGAGASHAIVVAELSQRAGAAGAAS